MTDVLCCHLLAEVRRALARVSVVLPLEAVGWKLKFDFVKLKLWNYKVLWNRSPVGRRAHDDIREGLSLVVLIDQLDSRFAALRLLKTLLVRLNLSSLTS